MNPQDFLRCTGDAFCQVRNERGELLGCIPQLAQSATGIRGADGQPYMLRIAAVSMLCVPNNCNPTAVIPGFIPLDMGANADLALPVAPLQDEREL